MYTVVPATGPSPNRVLLVGEAPGREESHRGIPFVGKSGQEQSAYLSRHRLNPGNWRRTNVVPEYLEGNPDPSPDLVAKWTPHLLSEVRTCNPSLIVAVGRFAARWFLGDSIDMDTVHGIPHRAGAFDPTRATRAPAGCCILPILHPAGGLYDNEARGPIAWDYSRVAVTLRAINSGHSIPYPVDEYAGREHYEDVDGRGLISILQADTPPVISIDTEGIPSNPWSIQISTYPGTGYVLRTCQRDFLKSIEYLQTLANKGILIILHNGMYDIGMSRAMRWDLRRAKLYDTMYAAYTLRVEPQGLKPLAWRWCGMRMSSYQDTLGAVDINKQLEYLSTVLSMKWPKSETIIVNNNDGSSKPYTPQHIAKRVEKIITDYYQKCSTPASTPTPDESEGEEDDSDNGDVENSGSYSSTSPVDLAARWAKVDDIQRYRVEDVLGRFPVATLDDIPLESAIRYSARDADATLRLYYAIHPETVRMDTARVVERGMAVLPMFEAMQHNGMPASRQYFQTLHDDMQREMGELVRRISTEYYGGRPFNPKSPLKVGALLRRRGLKGEELTSTGAVSTGKKSIEHLRHTDEAIAAVFDWRERQHIRDSYCKVVLKRMNGTGSGIIIRSASGDIYYIRCQLKTTRTATRRLASTNPNLLAIPSRTKLGVRVRHGFIAPPGMVFGAWDFSGIEMRCMAHESRDPLMCKLFQEGRDIHSETAALIFGKSLADVDIKSTDWKMNYRYPAKTVGFGVLYGLQAPGLVTQLRMIGLTDWNEKACSKMITEWLGVYSGVREYIARTIDTVRKEPSNIVRDYSGMPRYLPGILSSNSSVAAEAGRIAVSHRIQGLAQTMAQSAMEYLWPILVDLEDAGYNILPVLQVHDELVFLFDEELWDVMDALVTSALVDHCGIKLRVPVECEGHMSTTWGGLK